MSTRSEHQPGSATPADGPGLRFADRMASIGTVGSFDVAAKARQLEQDGHHVIHFEIGEPDFPTPENIVEAGVSAMRAGATHYTPPSGVAAAREAAAAYVGRRAGVPVGPENIVFVPGSKNIVYFTLLALVNPGDEVIVPDPGYPSYRALVEFTGATRVDLPLRPKNGFRPDPGELRSLVTARTKLLILSFPANPTGAVLTRPDAEELADVIIGNDLIVLVDEINARLTFDGEHISLYGLDGMAGRTVILDGLSKAWSMCGWRLGFGAMPAGLADRMDKLMVQTSACTATFSQAAAIEAFTAPESDRAVQAMVAEFRRRRDIVVPRLNSMAGCAATARPARSTPSLISAAPAGTSGSWPRACSARRTWPCSRASNSAVRERDTSGSRSPPRSRTSPRAWTASGTSSATRASQPIPSAATSANMESSP